MTFTYECRPSGTEVFKIVTESPVSAGDHVFDGRGLRYNVLQVQHHAGFTRLILQAMK